MNFIANKYTIDDGDYENDDSFDNEMTERSFIKHGLPTDVNYLVGFHPHGILATGAFINFATEATGFSKIFPSFKPFLAILKAHFIAPVYRDLLMSFENTCFLLEFVITNRYSTGLQLTRSSLQSKVINFFGLQLQKSDELNDSVNESFIIS
ncbi:unnamed protein product [Schistosoma turkestanicum]|nr:unnamed protein product [Schistosoma turkestanicum]